MKEKKFFSLPVVFTELKDYSFDDSLIPVDIKVMHDGLNYNNSTFYDEAIEGAKSSLQNKPILGYVQKVDGDDSKDFKGHEREISMTEDDIKFIYLERPLGVVPETSEYSTQEMDGKKYVCCRGYLWKEYLNEAYDILKDNPNKSVSMEIAVDDYDFYEDGSINILKYRYLGITILGDNVSPAMEGAKLDVVGQFSEKYPREIYNKIEELNNKLKSFEGGEKAMSEKKTLKDYEAELEQVKKDYTDLQKKYDDLKVDYDNVKTKYDESNEELVKLTNKNEELVKDHAYLENDNKDLQKFKNDILAQQRKEQEEQLFERFSKLEDVEEYKQLKERASEYSIEDLEKEIALIYARNANTSYSKKKEKKNIKVPFYKNDKKEQPYGGLIDKYTEKE